VQLILMRHGEPEREGHDPCDPGLSECGWAQARAAVPILRDQGVDAIYSSPQLRASQTADVIGDSMAVPVAYDFGLVEFDYGAEYVHYDDAAAATWQSYFAGDLSPWGLSREAFHARIATSMRRLADHHGNQRVLAVCHGGVINAWTCQALGVADRLRLFEPGYVSLHRYVAEGGRWQVVSLNESPTRDPLDK
jgi:probable phosphoglycerate mutase